MTAVQLICEAIRKRALLEFVYHDRRRVVAPYCCGESSRGADVLRAVQVRGESASGGMGFGKLWTVAEIADLRMLDEVFVYGAQLSISGLFRRAGGAGQARRGCIRCY